jgi:hypothetical protein
MQPSNPGITMHSTCLLGTDNGYIIKRTASDTFKVVYADNVGDPKDLCGPGLGPHANYGLPCIECFTQFTERDKVVGYFLCGFNCPGGVAWNYLQSSPDKGETFPVQSHIDGFVSTGYTGFEPPFSDVGWHFARRCDPAVGLSSFNNNWARSQNWLGIKPWLDTGINSLTSPFSVQQTVFVDRKFIWGMRSVQSGGSNRLGRTAIDGSGATSFTSAINVSVNPQVLRGAYSVDKLAQWTLDRNEPFAIIDISDPTAPVWNWHAALPSSMRIHQIQILDSSHMVALCFPPIASTPAFTEALGSIWVSANGGVTWEQKVPSTNLLAMPGQGNPSYTQSSTNMRSWMDCINYSYDHPNEVWIGTKYPYVLFSNDFGETWYYDIVSDSTFSAPPVPLYFFSVGCVDNPSVTTTVFRSVIVTLVGAT